MASREELLKELEELGRHPSGRKIRSDTGQTHRLPVNRKPRGDKSVKHNSYRKTADVYFAQFQKALRATALRNELGEIIGEGASRDENDLFDLRVSHKWRVITKNDGTSYKTKVALTKPLEKYRWEWLRQLAEETNDSSKFCKQYFIKPEEWDCWTFSEWANAYMCLINGRYNSEKILLSYFDENNNIINYPEFRVEE